MQIKESIFTLIRSADWIKIKNKRFYSKILFQSVDQIFDLKIVTGSTDQIFNLKILIRSADQILDLKIVIRSAGRIFHLKWVRSNFSDTSLKLRNIWRSNSVCLMLQMSPLSFDKWRKQYQCNTALRVCIYITKMHLNYLII